VAASWTFVLEHEALSMNARVVNVGAARWRYAKERDAWTWLVRAAKLRHRITPATGRRRITLTRIYARGQRELDPDNLKGGTKSLVDAIKREGLLVDDTREWLELHHAQEPGTERAVRVLLEELAADAALATAQPKNTRRP
jgi:hypothetical protein